MACAILAAGFAVYVSKHPMDFRVYHYGARGVFDGTRPMYGPTSGLGWPMHYRYPPLFLLLFLPFAWLPLEVAAGLWLILKSIVLVFILRAFWNILPAPDSAAAWIVPLLLAGPFLVQDFRYGNAQFFVFAFTTFSLLLVRKRPVLACAALALATIIKVWPVIFVPVIFLQLNDARARVRLVALTLLGLTGLALLPALHFGFAGNNTLLREWFQQEFATQTGDEEIWFPSQSLRGLMMRYLTTVDYSHVPDSSYRQVNVANWAPARVRLLSFGITAGIYGLFLITVWRRQQTNLLIDDALAFCLVALLEPFTQKYALVVLLFPAIVLGRCTDDKRVRVLTCGAIGLVWVQILIPGSAAQRWMQVIGLDFTATVFVALALVCLTRRSKLFRSHHPEQGTGLFRRYAFDLDHTNSAFLEIDLHVGGQRKEISSHFS